MHQTPQLKRPAFIIFTDKDGTMNLQDKNLNNIFRLVHAMNGMMYDYSYNRKDSWRYSRRLKRE